MNDKFGKESVELARKQLEQEGYILKIPLTFFFIAFVLIYLLLLTLFKKNKYLHKLNKYLHIEAIIALFDILILIIARNYFEFGENIMHNSFKYSIYFIIFIFIDFLIKKFYKAK